MTCSMDRWNAKVAIVTGGSKEIGFAVVEKLVNAGVTVIAVARGKERLEEVSKILQGREGKFFTFVGDISKEIDILNLFKWTKKNVGSVHILVNNANYYGKTNLTEGDTKIWKKTIDVQIIGLCIATREAKQTTKQTNNLKINLYFIISDVSDSPL